VAQISTRLREMTRCPVWTTTACFWVSATEIGVVTQIKGKAVLPLTIWTRCAWPMISASLLGAMRADTGNCAISHFAAALLGLIAANRGTQGRVNRRAQEFWLSVLFFQELTRTHEGIIEWLGSEQRLHGVSA
jgi:hypothetical protein